MCHKVMSDPLYIMQNAENVLACATKMGSAVINFIP